MAARTGVELWNLDAGPFVEVELDKPRYKGTIPFSQLIHEADVFITVPCLKTHITADYTVVLKNAYGQTPQWKRSAIHREYLLEEALVDLTRIRRPDLCIVDGFDGAEGIAGGTDFERPAHARLMLVGADPVAVDVVSRDLMGFAARTRYLNWAIEDGIGIGDPARIDVLGDAVDDLRRRFLTPGEELRLFLPGLTLYDGDACSGCRVAAQSALNRFRYQKLLKPLDMIYGGLGEPPEPKGETLVIGDCAERYAHLGMHITGCPPRVDAIVAALETAHVICHACRDHAIASLQGLPSSFSAHLRIVASGAEAFCGDRVERGQWHLELLVGDCMKRYAFVVNERAAQVGLDPARDIIWLRGCPIEPHAIEEALDSLHRAFREHEEAIRRS
jgi:Ni,Fe-hydrogenase III small subunit